jgi:hypothetical protein
MYIRTACTFKINQSSTIMKLDKAAGWKYLQHDSSLLNDSRCRRLSGKAEKGGREDTWIKKKRIL